MLRVKDRKEECYGCTACVHACTSLAIEMQPDNEGFLYPFVNESLCTRCGMCLEVCQKHKNLAKKNTRTPDCHYGWINDQNILSQSSSGGIFTLLAQDIIHSGGHVFGAAFNGCNELAHIRVDTIAELAPLRGSKYLQSHLGDCYPQVKKLLDADEQVLFSGTPCQISGLYAYLGKDHDNLLTADLICAGAPSQKVFTRYLRQLVPNADGPLTINFRDKSWGEWGVTISVKKGDTLLAVEKRWESHYTEGFLQALFNRPSCHSCPFATTSRVGDLTLGDFWGIHVYKPQCSSSQGISLLLVNNAKGSAWLQKIETNMAHWENVPLGFAKKESRLSGPKAKHPGRAHFFSNLDKADDFNALVNESLTKVEKHVGILNFCFGNGYGQVLLSYALHKVLQDLGYSSEVINHCPPGMDANMLTYEEFREAFLHRTNPYSYARKLESLNNRFGIFLSGSDQVWRYHRKFITMFYWVYGKKTIVSYAASFGLEHFPGTPEEAKIASNLLKRFDAISVREASGVAVCESLGVPACHVLDPTLLLHQSEYQPIIDSERTEIPETKYIAYYFLDEARQTEWQQSGLATSLAVDYQLVNLRINFDTAPLSVPAWLALLQKAEHVITDSYHCLLFSIIFQRSFIAVNRDHGGNERVNSLFEHFGISRDRFQHDLLFDPSVILSNQLDYEGISSRIEQFRVDAIAFLQHALSSPPTMKNKTKYPYFDEYAPGLTEKTVAKYRQLKGFTKHYLKIWLISLRLYPQKPQ